MLARPFRLRLRQDIGRAYRHSRRHNSANLEFRVVANQLPRSRATIVISTKVAKRAVVRNRARRRLRGLLRETWPQIKPGYDVLITSRSDLSGLTTQQLRTEVTELLQKAQLL